MADLGKSRGWAGVLRNKSIIKEDRRKEWQQHLCSAENFLKHADKDQDEALHFDPFLTEVFLVDAAQIHAVLTGKMLPEARVFFLWFGLKHPELICESELKAATVGSATEARVTAEDYPLFLRCLDQMA